MQESDKESYDKPKSSKRRRWEVKSKESFETSLALDSPCKNYYTERPKSSHSSVSRKNRISKNNKDVHFEDNEVSAKLSVLLDDAKDLDMEKRHVSKLRDSEENLINSELKNYFNEPHYDFNPSAPPMSPEEIPKTPKKKPCMKVTPIHSGVNAMNSKINDQLKQLHEDIVNTRHAVNNETTVPAIAVSGLLLGPSSSTFNGNVSTIYCERFNNFVVSSGNCVKYCNEPSQENKKTRKSYAFQLQTGFRTLSVFCQGILSGFCIAHSLMIFLLQDNIDVLLLKNGLEYTFYIFISILSTICLVAAFDRNDLAGTGVFSEQGIRIPWNPLMYFLLLTLNVIIIRAEDFISHYDNEKNHYEKYSIIYWWKFMCLSRSVFSLLAWIGIVSDPHTDALNNRVKELSAD